MRTFGPDAARYWLAADGKPVAKPFHLRWLLPALCGQDLKLWWAVWGLSWPLLASGTVFWARGTGASWAVSAAAAALLVALPGIWGPHSVRPVGVDLPAMAVGIWAAACFTNGQPVIGVVLVVWAACIKETMPVWVALWAWTPLALVGLVAPAVAAVVRKHEVDPVTAQPLLQRVHDHPVRSSLEHHRGQWRSAWFMVAPWGAGLAALLAPSPQLFATVGLAYGQLVVATDTVRLYQMAAGPVVCLAAAGVIPTHWLLLAVVVHAVWWREPVVG